MTRPSVEKSLDAEILTIMASDSSIAKSMDKTLKSNLQKRANLFLAGAAFLSAAIIPNMANAMDNTLKGVVVASTLAGVVANNHQPSHIPSNCDTQGVNGWKVGGASIIGAVLGNQVGGGRGKKVMTAIGAAVGGVGMNAVERNRIEQECMRNNVNYPSRNMNNQMPQDNIYYQGVIASTGQPYYVTSRNSVGIAGLYGKVQANYDINQVNPVVRQAMDETSRGLENSFRNLDLLAQSFNQRAYGNVESRYNVGNTDEARWKESQNQIRLEYLKQDFNQAYAKYAEDRAKFIHMADNAAMDSVNITQYQSYLNYVEPPVSAKIMFNGNLSNKYVVLPNARLR